VKFIVFVNATAKINAADEAQHRAILTGGQM
jgi:hypothetical protein